MRKLFIDDIRNPPDETWVLIRSGQDAIDYLEALYDFRFKIHEISLDHDMGHGPNGADVMTCLERLSMERSNLPFPKVSFHTSNPVGRKNMQLILDTIKRRRVAAGYDT